MAFGLLTTEVGYTFTHSRFLVLKQKETEQSRWFVDAVLPHEAGLRRWIKSRFSAIRDVDDLIQETFSRILKAYQTGPVPNPQAFLFVVSRNLAINRLQRKNLEFPPEAQRVDPHFWKMASGP